MEKLRTLKAAVDDRVWFRFVAAVKVDGLKIQEVLAKMIEDYADISEMKREGAKN